jgi:NifU-like protein involved in Fe-S cluster formation
VGCRHAHAAPVPWAGINPKVVSERFGHATVSITLATYSHAIPAMQEEEEEEEEDEALIAGLVFARKRHACLTATFAATASARRRAAA